MMTLYQFNQLDDNEKFEALSPGVFVEIRTEDKLRVQLYRVDDFYAEVFYDPDNNHIVRIRGFKSNSILAKYISL